MVNWYDENISMLSYLPNCVSSSELFSALAKGVDYGIKELKRYAKQVVNNCYILTADEKTVNRYEKLWLLAADGLSLDARKQRILAKMRQRPPINEAMLKLMMVGILGEIVKVENGIEDYSVIVKYREQTGTENVEFAKALLRELIPANMLLEIVYAYIEWKDVRAATWDILKAYSWKDVMSNEEITGGTEG